MPDPTLWPNACPTCGSRWSEKRFNTTQCVECWCRFEWILAEPPPGHHFDREGFGRYLIREARGRLKSAGPPKSAPGPLKLKALKWLEWTLYVVVLGGFAWVWWFLHDKPLLSR